MARGDNELFCRCAAGFEGILAEELVRLGMRRVRAQVGGVCCFGTQAMAYRACLWSRVATRVQLVLARVGCADQDELYRGVLDIPWEGQVLRGATIAVSAHGTNEALRNTAFTALKVKDAICDRLRTVWGARPDVDPKDPDLSVNVAIHPKKATVYLNLSGPSLHMRGYRLEGVQSEAPLKETLAASLLMVAGWHQSVEAGHALVDPMCGSGTLAIEAALMLANVAPGTLRTRWGFDGWAKHDAGIWESVCRAAGEARVADPPHGLIVAGDIDPEVVELARANALRAGVLDLIDSYVDDAANLRRHLRGVTRRAASGVLVVNPPYGERLGSASELPAVRAALSSAVDALPLGWGLALISPDEGIETALGRTPETTLDCYNGPIEVSIRTFDLDRMEPRRTQVVSLTGKTIPVRVAQEQSAQFASRLRKVARERLRWARREGVTCLRLFDADLPDYAFSLDLYEGEADGKSGRLAIIEEYARPSSLDRHLAGRRLTDAQAIAAAILDLDEADVIVVSAGKRSSHQKVRPTLPLTVHEGDLVYPIDLLAHPDSGLPLDMRGLRGHVAQIARGGRVACIGGMSCAVAVAAASCGARSVAVQEAFRDRKQMLEHMFAVNGLDARRLRIDLTDAWSWLEGETHARHGYDLVCMAPPRTFTGAKGFSFEFGRDHVSLVRKAMKVVDDSGALILAFRGPGVELDRKGIEGVGLVVEDLTASVAQPDFTRSRTPLFCYRIRRARAGGGTRRKRR